MPEDRDFISSETHELNYVLKKWDKKQHKRNRDILRDTLVKFRDDTSYKPHNRKSFYTYVEDKQIRDLLEDVDKKKKKAEKLPVLPDIEKEDLTIDEPFVNKAKQSKKQKMVKKQKISIEDLTVRRNTRVSDMKIESKGDSGHKTARKNLIAALIILLVIILIITLIIAGTCLFHGSRTRDSDDVVTENPSDREQITDNDRNTGEIESEVNTEASLVSFLETCTPFYFVEDLDKLLPGEEQKIAALTAYLAHFKSVELIIKGHTADIGMPEDEMELSKKRADVIKDLIMKQSSGSELHLTTKGYGAQQQVVPDPSEETIQLNRRVEITVINAESK